MSVIDFDLLRSEISDHPYPLLFATISGAHLYGFPSADSDFDLRGCHLLPLRQVLGLLPATETVEQTGMRQGMEIDLVTHDAYKFFSMLLKRNGYVLEQLYSPLIVATRPEHDALKAIARRCITRHHVHHYFGFADTQWKLFLKESPPRVKPLLYVYRVLLTGIHLMRTGEVEANINHLDGGRRLSFIPELVNRKISGSENQTLSPTEFWFHGEEIRKLRSELETAAANSSLPESPSGRDELNSLLVDLRMQA